MLNKRFGSLLARTAAGLLLATGISTATHAADITVTALPTSVAVGGTVSVFFDVTGLGADAMSLYSFQVHYDNALLAFGGYRFLDPASLRNQLDLPEPSSFGFAGNVADLTGGNLDVFGLSGNSPALLNTGQADEFRFLTLTFDALGASAATAVALDAGSSVFGDALADPLSVSFQSARAEIEIAAASPVPEPSALSLMLVALAGAGVTMRRSRRRLAGGVAGALVLSGAAMAQQAPQKPQAVAGATAIEAVVVQAQGMRLQLRSADGRQFWVTTKANVGADMVGKRLTGQVSARGDTLLVSNPVFTRVP